MPWFRGSALDARWLDVRRRRGEHPSAVHCFFVVLHFFELIWGFIMYDFWSPTEAERFKNTGRLSDFCFCYLLEFR